jgi:hypothetical protein
VTGAGGWTLAEIRHHYGEAYAIGAWRGGWRARRRDGRGEVTAPDLDALAELIREDYRRDPVSRD